MTSPWIVALCALPALAATAAAAPPSIDEICKSTACRAATTIKQPVDKARFMEVSIPRSPYVHDGAVNILSGETIHVQVIQRAGKIVALRHSKRPSDLKITFEVKRAPRVGSFLTVKNNLSRPIVYRALVNAPHGKWRHRPTSTCPVQARLSVYEHWPYSVLQPLLQMFRFAGPGDTACKAY